MCSQWWWRRLRKKQSIQVVEDLYCQNLKARQIRGLVDNLPFLPQKTKQNKLPVLALSKHKSQFWRRQWMIRIFRGFVPLGPCHSNKQSQRLDSRSAIVSPLPLNVGARFYEDLKQLLLLSEGSSNRYQIHRESTWLDQCDRGQIFVTPIFSTITSVSVWSNIYLRYLNDSKLLNLLYTLPFFFLAFVLVAFLKYLRKVRWSGASVSVTVQVLHAENSCLFSWLKSKQR